MTPVWFHRPLAVNDHGYDVKIVQRKLGLVPVGRYDLVTEAVVRGFQRGMGLPMTGTVDEATAVALGEQEGFGRLPEWWPGEPIEPGAEGYDRALGLLGVNSVDGVRRFQGNNRLAPTGVIDEETARLLAGLEVE